MSALDLETPDCVPTFEWFIDSSVGKALTGSTDPIDVVDALDIDGINIRADYRRSYTDNYSYTDEWGAVKIISGDCIDAIHKAPINDITRHDEYSFPSPSEPHRLETLERAANRFGDQRAIILNLRDGWSDMRDLLGYEECMVNLMMEPEHFSNLLERVVSFNLELAQIAVNRFDIKIIATTDDIANGTGLLVPPGIYMDIIAPAFRKVIKGYKDLGCRVIKHCDGNILPLIDFWIDAGINCIDPVDPSAGMTMDSFKTNYGAKICLKGNIDCKGALCAGTPEDVEKEVQDCILAGGHAGLILSSSNTIHSGVKPDNYVAMLNALRKYGRS